MMVKIYQKWQNHRDFLKEEGFWKFWKGSTCVTAVFWALFKKFFFKTTKDFLTNFTSFYRLIFLFYIVIWLLMLFDVLELQKRFSQNYVFQVRCQDCEKCIAWIDLKFFVNYLQHNLRSWQRVLKIFFFFSVLTVHNVTKKNTKENFLEKSLPCW